MREEGEATLLAKWDCTEIEQADARVLLREAVARPPKRASWLFPGLTAELLAYHLPLHFTQQLLI